MFGFQRSRIASLMPAEIAERHASGEIVLVDVREANEFATGHIAGALHVPLSRFDPAALPEGNLVFYCAIGRRSLVAGESSRKAGHEVAGHMEGGLAAWTGSGLPLVRD